MKILFKFIFLLILLFISEINSKESERIKEDSLNSLNGESISIDEDENINKITIIEEFTSKSFHKTILQQNSKEKWFIMFYAPWCQISKSVMPLWEKIATNVSKSFDIHIGKVDCEASKDLAKLFLVLSYPTLIMIEDGKYYIYNEERTTDKMYLWAKNGYLKTNGYNVKSKVNPAEVWFKLYEVYIENLVNHIKYEPSYLYIICIIAILILIMAIWLSYVISKRITIGVSKKILDSNTSVQNPPREKQKNE